jgi:hypothetical protein
VLSRAVSLKVGFAVQRKFTIEMYDRMIEVGIIQSGEPYELIDGWIVHKDRSAVGEGLLTIGTKHNWAIVTLTHLDQKLEKMGCSMQTQGPIAIPPHNEPEPDGAILIGNEDTYLHCRPTPADCTYVIEVADNSLEWDRTTKQRIYADAGIAQYVIINLVDNKVEVHTEPKPGQYGRVEILVPGDKLSLPTKGAKPLVINVRSLLPPRSD